MKQIVALMAVAVASGCAASGEGAMRNTAAFGYPPVTGAEVPGVPVDATTTVGAIATVPATPFPGPEAHFPVYDETKDPLIAAALAPPAGDPLADVETVGSVFILPPPARLDVIDISGGRRVLMEADLAAPSLPNGPELRPPEIERSAAPFANAGDGAGRTERPLS